GPGAGRREVDHRQGRAPGGRRHRHLREAAGRVRQGAVQRAHDAARRQWYLHRREHEPRSAVGSARVHRRPHHHTAEDPGRDRLAAARHRAGALAVSPLTVVPFRVHRCPAPARASRKTPESAEFSAVRRRRASGSAVATHPHPGGPEPSGEATMTIGRAVAALGLALAVSGVPGMSQAQQAAVPTQAAHIEAAQRFLMTWGAQRWDDLRTVTGDTVAVKVGDTAYTLDPGAHRSDVMLTLPFRGLSTVRTDGKVTGVKVDELVLKVGAGETRGPGTVQLAEDNGVFRVTGITVTAP